MNLYRFTLETESLGRLELVVQAENPETALLCGLSRAFTPWAGRFSALAPWLLGSEVRLRVDQFGPVHADDQGLIFPDPRVWTKDEVKP